MRKTDKKLDNQLRTVLTDVCEVALKEIDGFQWLTHLVNCSDFPNSLKVVCVFDTNENLSSFMSQEGKAKLSALIQEKLVAVDVKLKNMTGHILYDTEQDCEREHHGNWADRLTFIT
jgi:hypothetical protein